MFIGYLEAKRNGLESVCPPWDLGLLSDTKAAEDLAEQILTGEFTGDLAQRELCEPKILGE